MRASSRGFRELATKGLQMLARVAELAPRVTGAKNEILRIESDLVELPWRVALYAGKRDVDGNANRDAA
jgi:hypothetical protein